MVAKAIDSTVPHTLKILAEMEVQGLISSRPQGRIRRLDLTEHGQRAAFALSRLVEVLGPESRGNIEKRLGRLEELVGDAEGLRREETELRLGPLRRDLARLKGSEDEDIRSAAEALDWAITERIQK